MTHTTYGGVQYWAYRVSVALVSVLWSDFFRLQKLSTRAFLGFNVLLVIVGFSVAQVAMLTLDTAPPTTPIEEGADPRLPEFSSYAAGFFLTVTLANGLVFKTRHMFSWLRAGYFVVAIVLTPLGRWHLLPASLGQLYWSAGLGCAAGLATFCYVALVFRRLADIYELERRQAMLDTVGVLRTRQPG